MGSCQNTVKRSHRENSNQTFSNSLNERSFRSRGNTGSSFEVEVSYNLGMFLQFLERVLMQMVYIRKLKGKMIGAVPQVYSAYSGVLQLTTRPEIIMGVNKKCTSYS